MATKFKTAHVIFQNPEYNYKTSVNPNSTDESIKEYFVGKLFNVGEYPVEKMRTCIDCKVSI